MSVEADPNIVVGIQTLCIWYCMLSIKVGPFKILGPSTSVWICDMLSKILARYADDEAWDQNSCQTISLFTGTNKTKTHTNAFLFLLWADE